MFAEIVTEKMPASLEIGDPEIPSVCTKQGTVTRSARLENRENIIRN